MSLTMQDKIAELKRQNPMYGLTALNTMRANAASAKTQRDLQSILENAYNEALKASKDAGTTVNVEAFFCHFLEIGDITNREHRVFAGRKGIDNGGHAARKQWTWAMEWLIDKDEELFARLIPTFIAFVSLAVMTEAQVRTEKKSKKILGTWGILIKIMAKAKARKALLAELKRMWNSGNPMDKIAVAKFMRLPRLSARSRVKKCEKVKRELQDTTKQVQGVKKQLMDEWCVLMGFEIDNSKGFTYYKGWSNARAEYNGDTEYVLFSTGKVRNFDQVQFTDWLDGKLNGRSIARPNDHVIRCHLLNKDNTPKRESALDAKGKPDATKQGKLKWDTETKPFSKWFLNWEAGKLKAQEEERVIKEKVRKGEATVEDQIRLKEVSKEAKTKKVAQNLPDLVKKLNTGNLTTSEFDMTAHSVMQLLKMNAPVMVMADISGSMGMPNYKTDLGYPKDVAALITTIAMLSNPSPDMCDVLCTFANDVKMYVSGYPNTSTVTSRGLMPKTAKVTKLVDRTATFSSNLATIKTMVHASGGGTNVNSIYEGLERWLNESSTEGEKQVKREAIAAYPTLMIISDGEFNNASSAKQSLSILQTNMKRIFGWEGFIVVWDVVQALGKENTFLGMENVIHIGGCDPTAISKVFEHISDVDIVDTFTQLRTTWQSNRYDPIKVIVSDYYKHLQKPERAIPKPEIVE